MIECDINKSEAITKFVWLSKQKNIFGCASNNSIRIGYVNEGNNLKSIHKFKLHIDRQIRDFDINI
jgi:hypothetical protein